jgi:hypothetical protein
MKWFKRALVALLAASAILVPASPAMADDSSELPGCKYYWTGVGASYGGGIHSGAELYTYGPQLTSPSNSACEDIQIVALYTMSPSMHFRVRFYPSGGGNYANSWKKVNNSCWSCNMVIATNVANGTVWRVEGVEIVGDIVTALSENFDVNA